jgi:hypothetical protein
MCCWSETLWASGRPSSGLPGLLQCSAPRGAPMARCCLFGVHSRQLKMPKRSLTRLSVLLLVFASVVHTRTMASDLLTVPGPAGALEGEAILVPGAQAGVIIVPGSGPTDRDGNSRADLRTDSYKLLAKGLATAGISTLRIDKRRGAAASEARSAAGPDTHLETRRAQLSLGHLFQSRVAAKPRCRGRDLQLRWRGSTELDRINASSRCRCRRGRPQAPFPLQRAHIRACCAQASTAL